MPIQYKLGVMARYDRECLVPYLEDICALQLSKKKAGEMIEACNEEIAQINQTALSKVVILH